MLQVQTIQRNIVLQALLIVGDNLQKQIYNFQTSNTLAPVVNWSTVCMFFSLGVINDWKTASIDFKSAFIQAKLPEPVYFKLPLG